MRYDLRAHRRTKPKIINGVTKNKVLKSFSHRKTNNMTLHPSALQCHIPSVQHGPYSSTIENVLSKSISIPCNNSSFSQPDRSFRTTKMIDRTQSYDLELESMKSVEILQAEKSFKLSSSKLDILQKSQQKSFFTRRAQTYF